MHGETVKFAHTFVQYVEKLLCNVRISLLCMGDEVRGQSREILMSIPFT